jgi:hypothetical protein
MSERALGVAGLLTNPRWFRHRVVLGVVLIALGTWISRRAFNEWGADLAQLYMSAWLLREGKNVYDYTEQHSGYMRHIGEVTTWGHFYPPGSAVALLPATLIPYSVARQLWFVLGIVVMLYGLWRFMAAFLPQWDRSLRVLVLGVVMCTACVRWGFKVAQPVSLVLGLFAIFMVEFRNGRTWLAVLCAAISGAIKVTFGMPFVLLALAVRRFKIAVLLVGIWGVMNLVGMYGMGGPKIMVDFKANMATFERPDQLNYPDPRGFNSLARTDWPYLLNAVSPNFSRNNLIGNVLTLASLAWLVFEVMRAKPRLVQGDVATLALTGPIAALSMLAVYHHHYDIGLMLLPLLAYLGRPELRRIGVAWAFIVPVGLYAGAYPYEKFAKLLEAIMGPSYVLISKPMACAVCVVALISSMFVVRAVLRKGEIATDGDPSPSLKPALR